MSRTLARRLLRRPTRLAVNQLEDRATPALFTPGTPISRGSATANYGCVVAADLNGDGKSDIVVTNYGADGTNSGLAPGQTVGLMLGDGNGGFATPTTYSCGSNQYVSYVAVGDVTGDGIPDLVAVSSTASTQTGLLTVFKGGSIGGVPTGTYSKVGQVGTGGGNSSWVGLADVTGDGKLDAVVCSFGYTDSAGSTLNGNNVTVLQGDGAGNFSLINTVANGLSFIPTSATLGDFDGDGKTDIACTVPGVPPDSTSAQPNGTVQLLTGNGAGGFSVGTSFDSGGPLPIAVSAADLNGDGKPDLVVTNAGNPDQANNYASFGTGTAVGVALNAGGSFTAPTALTAGLNSGGSTSAFASVVADLDGDGKLDIGTIVYGHPVNGTNARVAVYHGSGTGSFTADPNAPFNTQITDGQFLAVGKFYGATAQDLVVVGATNRLNTLKNNTVVPASTATTVTAAPSPSAYGVSVTFTATVTTASGTPTGTVGFYDGTTLLGSGTLTASGTASYATTTPLGVGTHSVTARYGGAPGFAASTSTALSHVVNVATTLTSLVANPTTVDVGSPVVLTVTVAAGGVVATGEVTFLDGGVPVVPPVPLDPAGKQTLNWSGFTVGKHVLTVSYAGTANLAASTSSPVTVTVNPPAPPTVLDPTVMLRSSANPSGFGGPVTFSVVVSGTGAVPTGTVTFLDGTTPLGSPQALVAGAASLPALTTLSAGSHSITAKYNGDAAYNPATSPALTQVVTAISTTTVLATSLSPAAVTQSVVLTATVMSAVPVSGGVRFLDNGTPLGTTVPLGSGGVASFTTTTLTLGTHTLTAEFVPLTPDYLPSISGPVAQVVKKAAVTVTVSSGGPVLVSQPVNLVATLTGSPALANSPSGSVVFKLDGVTIGVANVSGGTAGLVTSSLPAGGGTVTAEYAGDGSYDPAVSGGFAQVVNKGGVTLSLQGGKPATVGGPVTLVATVAESPALAPDPTGTVTFKRGTVVIGTAALSGGSATLVTSDLPVGAASITAEYAGDGNFLPAVSGPVSQLILPASSSVRVSSSGSPTVVTEVVTLTAAVTVAGGGTPAGTVQFFAGGTAISGLLNVSGGVASFSTSALPVGTSSVTAQFTSSDPNVSGSTSTGLSQQVVRATPAVTVGVDVAAAGLPSAVRAQVSKPSGVAADPGGMVTFRVNGTAVATVPVVGGVATTSVTLPSGASTITADFAGDTNFSTGAASVQAAVSPPPKLLPREFAVGAGAGRPADAALYNSDGSLRYTAANLFGGTGGVRVTSADFNGDGVADLVAGTGPGVPTRVVILDGVTKAQLFAVDPFEASFTGGVYVATGDLTGDGVPELIISPDEGGGPRVRIFNGAGFGGLDDFFGIDDPNFRGGARAGVADLTGDGRGDLVVAAGFGGGPRVAVFDGKGLGADHRKPYGDFYVFEQTLRNGAFVTAGDVDGDGVADLISGGGPGGGPRVTILSGADLLAGRTRLIADFFAGDESNRGGVRVVARNLDGDKYADVVTGAGTGGGNRVSGYLGKTLATGTGTEAFGFDAFPGFSGGVYVG